MEASVMLPDVEQIFNDQSRRQLVAMSVIESSVMASLLLLTSSERSSRQLAATAFKVASVALASATLRERRCLQFIATSCNDSSVNLVLVWLILNARSSVQVLAIARIDSSVRILNGDPIFRTWIGQLVTNSLIDLSVEPEMQVVDSSSPIAPWMHR